MPCKDVPPETWPRPLRPPNIVGKTAVPRVFDVTNRVTTSWVGKAVVGMECPQIFYTDLNTLRLWAAFGDA